MGRETRLANKTQWSLQDIIAACQRGKRCLVLLRERNDKLLDPIFAIQVTNLIDVLSTIEVTAVLAQRGQYRQEINQQERSA